MVWAVEHKLHGCTWPGCLSLGRWELFNRKKRRVAWACRQHLRVMTDEIEATDARLYCQWAPMNSP